MGSTASALPTKRGHRLVVGLAAGPDDVMASQALRYRVFAEEMGANLEGGAPGRDADEFDPYCQHLLVRDLDSGVVVGSTRVLSDEGAARIGRFYSEGEFDIESVRALPGRMLEVGRTCIAADYRHGAAIAMLWSGLAAVVKRQGFDYLFGCVSLPLGEDGMQAAAIMNRLRQKAMADDHIRVTPRVPLCTAAVAREVLDAPLPPLLKAYVRLGAKACGEPCRDDDFHVADVFMLLAVKGLRPDYSRHFLERGH